jgi:hypothetical protein
MSDDSTDPKLPESPGLYPYQTQVINAINTPTTITSVDQMFSIYGKQAGTYSYDPLYSSRRIMTAEELAAQDEYRRKRELQEAIHEAKIAAVETYFPHAHDDIEDLHLMVDIARENQLNPLYEELLKNFDEATLVLSRAANKLAAAVKLTDMDELEVRKENDDYRI